MNKLLLRVPEVSLIFWIIKTLSTTVGETGADFLSFNLGFGMPLVAIIGIIIMAILYFMQFKKFKKYVPIIYWSLVVLMSIVGTLITDILVDMLGISLLTLNIVFFITMLAGFYFWYKKEGTLSIHSIDNSKREIYYWIIVLLAFALGTATGDYLSEALNLGYIGSLEIFAGAIAFIVFIYYGFNINSILTFWIAFILTRPLGASIGDFLIQPTKVGGLGLGGGMVNTVFLLIIILLVSYLTLKHKDIYIEEQNKN